jgi:hypothetical protein
MRPMRLGWTTGLSGKRGQRGDARRSPVFSLLSFPILFVRGTNTPRLAHSARSGGEFLMFGLVRRDGGRFLLSFFCLYTPSG